MTARCEVLHITQVAGRRKDFIQLVLSIWS